MDISLSEIQEQISFLKITDQTIADLKEFYPTLEKYFDRMIDIFLAQAATNPQIKESFKDVAQANFFKALIKRHWQDLYQGNLTKEYYHRTMELGTIYNQAGLESEWIIGGYAHILNAIIDLTIDTVSKNPERLRNLQKSIIKVSYLNMNLTLKTFQKKGDEGKSKDLIGKISGALDKAIQVAVTTIVKLTQDMSTNSHSMEQTLEKASLGMQKASSLTERNRGNVNTVLSSAEHLLNSVQQISQQTNRSSLITAQAVTTSQQANEVIHHLIGAGTKIGEVVKLISDIASQTNLLALNATIEAARAGEAGKGFAVVAAEVKNLATQTAKATEEISQQVTSIQQVTQNAVNEIDSVGKIINEVNQISHIITGAIEGQTSATMDITQTIQQTAQESVTFSTWVEEASSTMIMSTQSAKDLKQKSEQISIYMTELKAELSQILAQTLEDQTETSLQSSALKQDERIRFRQQDRWSLATIEHLTVESCELSQCSLNTAEPLYLEIVGFGEIKGIGVLKTLSQYTVSFILSESEFPRLKDFLEKKTQAA